MSTRKLFIRFQILDYYYYFWGTLQTSCLTLIKLTRKHI